MEKLQAALARAREKRDNDGRPVVRSQFGNATSARKTRKTAAVDERWAGLGMLEPSSKRMKASRILSIEATGEAQHFDILRTKLMLEMRRNDWTRIAITSATPGCGKTTSACNLIAGLGRQPELRGMLFDLDFRRPAVAKYFGVSPVSSLEDVLSQEILFEDQALRLHDNTIISMTTGVVSDPAQVILRSQTAELFDQIQDDYQPDLMLFDMPPVLVSDETRGFLKQVDAVLIIAGAEVTTVAQIDDVEREVAQYSNVAGIVLNKCQFMEENYSYSY
jgi:Mrp family chromosome partitioning ATPase